MLDYIIVNVLERVPFLGISFDELKGVRPKLRLKAKGWCYDWFFRI